MLKILKSETFRLFSLGFGVGAAGLLLFSSPEKPVDVPSAAAMTYQSAAQTTS